MANLRVRSSRAPLRSRRDRGTNPDVEGLESRVLLYSALGDQWTYSSRITFSLMPDGTNVGGISSALYQTLNANYPTVSWKQQIEAAASLWENVTNINLAMVSDSGQAVGSSGNQQDDSQIGDIRIGAIPLGAGTLAVTFLPPPANGGTDAGDILLNSNVNWRISSNYDLMTVVAHEFGHALGLGESTVSTAVMYGTYNGIKQTLASDDIQGIQSIYGMRQFDQFNAGGLRNNTYITATNIDSFVKNAQIAISGLDITTAGDTEWFYVDVPTSSTGTMSVTVQSSNLSSLSPKLQVYTSQLGLMAQAGTVASLGATVTVSANVRPGQGYYFKVLAAGGPGPIGDYGLLVNFGSQPQAPILPPNTVVSQQPDRGGGAANLNALASTATEPESGSCLYSAVGMLTGWTEALLLPLDWSGSTVASVSNLISEMATALEAVAISTAGSSGVALNMGGASVSNISLAGAITYDAASPGLAILQAIDEAIDDANLLFAGSQNC
jgi:Matrixin